MIRLEGGGGKLLAEQVPNMNLRAPAKFASLGRHFHFFPFLEKERNANLEAGFQLG